MRNLTDDQILKLCEHLQGSSNTLNQGLENLFELDEDYLTMDDCLFIDSIIFCCEFCGWWFEIGEMSENENDDWICEDCNS